MVMIDCSFYCTFLTVYAWGTEHGTSQSSTRNSVHYNATFNEGLNDLYSSPNTVRVIKSRKIRWAGHVARIGKGRVL